jgi:hypothetical protein
VNYMLCRNRVADFAKWKHVFDFHAEARHAAGFKLVRMWRGLDDPNNVFFLFEIADVERARAFVGSPEAAEIGKLAGVIDGELHLVQGD